MGLHLCNLNQGREYDGDDIKCLFFPGLFIVPTTPSSASLTFSKLYFGSKVQLKNYALLSIDLFDQTEAIKCFRYIWFTLSRQVCLSKCTDVSYN